MTRRISILISVLILACAFSIGQTAVQKQEKEASFGAQIDSLLAMKPEQRRAALKQMNPTERKGIWMQLKQAKAWRVGNHTPAGFYKDSNNATAVINHSNTWGSSHAPGTVVYDSGFPTIGFGGGAIVGNKFDTHTGWPMFVSGTISTIQAQVVPGPSHGGSSSSAGFVIEGPQTVGGGAFALFSSFTTATGVVDSVTFAGLGVNYTGSSFMVLFGDFASSYIPVFGTGSTQAQGHHGMVGYTGSMGPNITGTFDFGGTLNSFIRATGNIVPVELMKFDVE